MNCTYQFCSYRRMDYRSHMRHTLERHLNEPNFEFTCEINTMFCIFNTLRSHISRKHFGVPQESLQIDLSLDDDVKRIAINGMTLTGGLNTFSDYLNSDGQLHVLDIYQTQSTNTNSQHKKSSALFC